MTSPTPPSFTLQQVRDLGHIVVDGIVYAPARALAHRNLPPFLTMSSATIYPDSLHFIQGARAYSQRHVALTPLPCSICTTTHPC
jgi:hypothetical protein